MGSEEEAVVGGDERATCEHVGRGFSSRRNLGGWSYVYPRMDSFHHLRWSPPVVHDVRQMKRTTCMKEWSELRSWSVLRHTEENNPSTAKAVPLPLHEAGFLSSDYQRRLLQSAELGRQPPPGWGLRWVRATSRRSKWGVFVWWTPSTNFVGPPPSRGRLFMFIAAKMDLRPIFCACKQAQKICDIGFS